MKINYYLILFLTLIVLISFSCTKAPNPNVIQSENSKEGSGDWLIKVNERKCDEPNHLFCRRPEIEAYCSHTSIIAGEKLSIMVSTDPASEYSLNIFRMGYYGGKGERLMKTSNSLKGTPQAMPAIDSASNFLECKWDTAISFIIPPDWISGVYLGKLTAKKDSAQSYIIFIVKDNRKAAINFQCSDLTWQAYNRWPYWHSMYDEGHKPWINTNKAKLSFDRPYALYVNGLPSDFNGLTNGSGEFLLWEFPMAFWLEKEGYDVTYTSNIDTHEDAEGLLRTKTFISLGHDEYWTYEMQKNVTAARDKGINLMFLNGNSMDGTIYLNPSSEGRPNRVTGRLPEREFTNEQDLIGASSYGVGFTDFVCRKPDHWIFQNTGMKQGDTIKDFIGWEYHGYPLGKGKDITVLSDNKIKPNVYAAKNAPDYASTIYEGPKGNFVFNAGTCWWSMLLTSFPGYQHPVCNDSKETYRKIDFSKPDPRVIQMTKNLLGRRDK